MKWRWRVLLPLAALIVVMFVGRSWMHRGPEPAKSKPPVAASPLVSDVAEHVRRLNSTASRFDSVPAAAPVDESEALMRRMKADWCGFGVAEHQRESEEIMAEAQARQGTVGMEAIGEMKQTPGARVMENAVEEAR
ncbi:MAG: hypothetical protein EOP39_10140 [Rubrivivax sp.]|nr:MAG: hypothetical protein EOP39_10140 [Rubrivivax sp.]